MTQLERLSSILSDGHWHSTEELVQEVGHRFSATMHTAIKKHSYQIEKRRRGDRVSGGGGTYRQYEYRMIVTAKQQVN